MAAYHCEGCDAAIAEHHKTQMLGAANGGDGNPAEHVEHRLSPVQPL